MATLSQHIDLEKKHFEKFKIWIPGIDNLCSKTLDQLLDNGIIQISTAFEHAIANAGKLQVESIHGADFSDGSDAKLSTARYCWNGKRYSAPVKMKNKTGWLRIQVYERNYDNFYYFKIPFESYKEVKPTSNIEIPFEIDGTPKRQKHPQAIYHWWRYEVKDFLEMAL